MIFPFARIGTHQHLYQYRIMYVFGINLVAPESIAIAYKKSEIIDYYSPDKSIISFRDTNFSGFHYYIRAIYKRICTGYWGRSICTFNKCTTSIRLSLCHLRNIFGLMKKFWLRHKWRIFRIKAYEPSRDCIHCSIEVWVMTEIVWEDRYYSRISPTSLLTLSNIFCKTLPLMNTSTSQLQILQSDLIDWVTRHGCLVLLKMRSKCGSINLCVGGYICSWL